MKRLTTRKLLASVTSVTLVALVSLAGAMPTFAGTVTAFRGGTVHPVSSEPITGATVLVEDGKITAVGSSVEVPANAEVIDFTGKHLYPGFVHPGSVLGLVEINSVAGTRDFREIGENNSDLRSEIAFHADSKLLPTAIAGGVLNAHVVQRGGVFAGTSAVMRLAGWNYRDMIVETPIGTHLFYPAVSGGDDEDEAAKTAREKALTTINETIEQARAYRHAKEAQSPGLEVDGKLERLLPLLAGEMPLFIHAPTQAQMVSALDWASEKGFEDIVLVASSDARYITERLAADKVPVILAGVLDEPDRNWEPYDIVYTAATALHEAGIRFAISDLGGDDDAANARNLPFHAAMAAAFGLPKDAALRSVTLSAAEILGVEEHIGSIDVGKEASLFISDGNPLEILTRIERVWIRGQEFDLRDEYQYRLYQRYNNRPKPAADSPE